MTAKNDSKTDWQLKIIEDPEEFKQVEKLQGLVWTSSELDIVPAHLMIASVRNGGMVIGAYKDPANQTNESLIGFVFGFPGIEYDGSIRKLKFCSHEMGVHPDFRGMGIGFALKKAQRQLARSMGYEKITWTYDPLLSVNANLNIHRLGAVCHTFVRNYYGVMRDGLNKNSLSDRFQVDWWLNSKRVNNRISEAPRQQLGFEQYHSSGCAIVSSSGMQVDETQEQQTDELKRIIQTQRIFLLEIPCDYRKVTLENPEIAYRWRIFTRNCFELIFEAGFIVTDFVFAKENTTNKPKKCYYVMTHEKETL